MQWHHIMLREHRVFKPPQKRIHYRNDHDYFNQRGSLL